MIWHSHVEKSIISSFLKYHWTKPDQGHDTRTPENQPVCITPGPGNSLRFEACLCAESGYIWESLGSDVCAKIQVILWLDRGICKNPGDSEGHCQLTD